MATKTRKKPSKAQQQRRKKARARRPDLSKLYRYKRDPLDIASQEFRATLIRRAAKRKADRRVSLDGIATEIAWEYRSNDPVLTGSLAVQVPDLGPDTGFKIADGDVLKLDCRWGGHWREVWRMRLRNGDDSLASTRNFELADDGILLQESTDHWHFTKSKHHPKGWLLHEIVREVARRYRIPVGKVAQGKHRITGLSGMLTPMQVLQKAASIEKQANGRRFVIRWEGGKLNVLPMQRNDLLYQLGPQIEDASISKEERDERFATAVTVRARVRRQGSRRRQKVEVRYANEKAIKQEGFVHKVIGGSGVRSRADAIRKAKRYIAKHSVRKRTLTGLRHRGIAFLRRGDAIWVDLPQKGFRGRRAVCFVSAGRWSLSGGDFTMDLDVSFDDPFYTAKARRKDKDKKVRAAKRAKRKKK